MNQPILRPSNTIVGQLIAIALGLACAGFIWAGDQPGAPESTKKPSNRLSKESSPYLLQHAHNPVDWHPWGSEAFAKAKKEGKLVFLSIGYSSCHWCHVMERESFDNAEVAKQMNENFVCIKVDREERPDIDAIYMTALNVIGTRGGWPLSMFLTPEGKPIIGGTYWPPEDKVVEGERIPGFKTVLKRMQELHKDKEKELRRQADKVAELTQQELGSKSRGVAIIDLDRTLVNAAIKDLKDEFDPEYGGFGSAARRFRGTKFPTPPCLELLLQEAGPGKSAEAAGMLHLTLERMARGGIYDQIGGGFHRYSTERTWTVPHFEKMLYDNAQLMEVYARAYEQTRNPLYQRIIRETLAFIDREMTSPGGGFYSALDADSSGTEGLFYVWTDKEIQQAIPDIAERAFLEKVYCTSGAANFEEKYHIFTLAKSTSDLAKELQMTEVQLQTRLTPLQTKLLGVRAKRARPFLDTKILTGWNGQMIAGYAAAGKALAEPAYTAKAVRAAEFVLKNLRTKEGRLLRTYNTRPGQLGEARLNGYLDDYAYMVHGLLALHDAAKDARWLTEATAISDAMVRFFQDKDAGGYFYTSNDHEALFARAKDQYDGAQPSGNSVAISNFVRLWMKTGEGKYKQLAEKSLQTFSPMLKSNPTSLTFMASALSQYLGEQRRRTQRETLRDRVVVAEQGKKSDSVVKVTAKAEPEKSGADGKQKVTITITIEDGWHIYANPAGLEDLESVQTKVTITAKSKPEEVKIEYPEGKEIKDKVIGNYKVYEEKATIKATVRRSAGDDSPLEITVKFQACNDKQCLLPATKTLTVP